MAKILAGHTVLISTKLWAVFLGKADGAGQSTKARTQSLLLPSRFQPNPNVLPEAGPLGTNKGRFLSFIMNFSIAHVKSGDEADFSVSAAFIGKGDGSGQSTKAQTQSLLMPRRFQVCETQ